MATTIVDTNVWFALFDESDTCHAKARTLFLSLPRPITLHEYIYMETLTVLARRAGKDTVRKFIKTILGNKDVVFLPASRDHLSRATELFASLPSISLSSIDVTLLVLSQNAKIITFDKNLLRAIKRLR